MGEFWTDWSDVYLKNLLSVRGGRLKGSLVVGSVVLVKGEGPCLDWTLGIVVAVDPGKDWIVCSVEATT